MKKIFLAGDSIRRGYDLPVRQKLAGRAEVFSSAENGQFAQYTLKHLNEWAKAAGHEDEIEVVHWNNGLWDVLHQYGDECLTPPDFYASMLRRIHKRIGILFPKARVIFALTTPVIEEQNTDPNFTRTNDDIERYNAIASDVMKELGVKVNDLYHAAKGFPLALYADWTHYTAEGYELLADAVIKACTE
ncbi:hypothetical protein FACS1894110_12690 [Spirochaetia bacterium]|nr:hypothetical protein FACS1894110_12690 [Spirochaetia bacterium]